MDSIIEFYTQQLRNWWPSPHHLVSPNSMSASLTYQIPNKPMGITHWLQSCLRSQVDGPLRCHTFASPVSSFIGTLAESEFFGQVPSSRRSPAADHAASLTVQWAQHPALILKNKTMFKTTGEKSKNIWYSMAFQKHPTHLQSVVAHRCGCFRVQFWLGHLNLDDDGYIQNQKCVFSSAESCFVSTPEVRMNQVRYPSATFFPLVT